MVQLGEKGLSYTAAFFMLIAFAIAGFIFGGLISSVMVLAMTGMKPEAISGILTNPIYYREIQIMQTITSVFGMLVSTIITASRLTSRPLELTGFRKKIEGREIFFVLLITACGLGISSALGYLGYQIPFPAAWKKVFEGMENNYATEAANMIRLNTPVELLISLGVLALVPAICEETFFRGGLQNYLYRSSRNMWLSIIVISLLFSAIHFSVYGFLARFALGMILGLIYHYTGKIWLNILMHFINNAAAVLSLYAERASGKSILQLMNDKSGNYWGLLFIPIIAFLFIKLKSIPSSKPQADGI
jgi:uncharacterized protein